MATYQTHYRDAPHLSKTVGMVPTLRAALLDAEEARKSGVGAVDILRTNATGGADTIAVVHPEGDVIVGSAATPPEAGDILNLLEEIRRPDSEASEPYKCEKAFREIVGEWFREACRAPEVPLYLWYLPNGERFAVAHEKPGTRWKLLHGKRVPAGWTKDQVFSRYWPIARRVPFYRVEE